MGYQVTNGNSKKFTIDGQQYALACVADPDFNDSYTLGVFVKTAAGDWNCPVGADYNGIIDGSVTTEKIMAFGTVAAYLQSVLPLASAKLVKILGVTKPDPSDKPACLGYDLAIDVDFDPATQTFRLNKQPPLSHAR